MTLPSLLKTKLFQILLESILVCLFKYVKFAIYQIYIYIDTSPILSNSFRIPTWLQVYYLIISKYRIETGQNVFAACSLDWI